MDRDDILERFKAIDTSNAADVLDTLGYYNQSLSPEFAPKSGDGKLAGWAYTISGQMTPYSGEGDPEKMRACAGISKGEVSVWSGDGAGICYFGELIAIGMQERGCVGALVDGGVRDLKWLHEWSFSTFARYRTPTQSIGRWRVNSFQSPVYMRGATSTNVVIAPGDFILGDEDGVIVIPQTIVLDVLEKAEGLMEKEVQIRSELRKGMTLSDALKKYGHV